MSEEVNYSRRALELTADAYLSPNREEATEMLREAQVHATLAVAEQLKAGKRITEEELRDRIESLEGSLEASRAVSKKLAGDAERRWPYTRLVAVEAMLRKIEEVLDRSPECDKYVEEDSIKCGWKSDLLEIKEILTER